MRRDSVGNPQTQPKDLRYTALKIFVGIIWLTIILFCVINRDKFSVDEMLLYTPKNPVLAALVMLCLFALKSLSIVIFSGLLYAANGVLFPLPVALLVNILGTAVMVSIPYFIGKKGGESIVNQIVRKHKKIAMLRDFQNQNDFLFTLMLRLIIVLPSDVLSVYLGACGVRYFRYLLAGIIGMMPMIVTFPIIGMSAGDIHSPEFWISIVCNLGFILVSLVIYAGIKKKNRTEH